ncbi:lysoplasmalogenase [Candidatus Saccharibacteria bacterium]|nr:lysoplasmalogenase [Candidatus Saccharibacteria bacterium]
MLKKVIADLKRIRTVDWRWLVIWIIIYASFLFLDIFSPDFLGATLIKYTGIFLCLVYAYQKFRHDTLLILALLFTLLADTILVWTPYYIPGVYAFVFAQFFHMARFTKPHPKTLIGFFLIVFVIFAAGVTQGIDPIYVIAFIYASTLLLNVGLAISWYRQDKQNFHARCACYGFILFLACDLSVAMQYLSSDHVIPAVIFPVVSYLVWLFYYPSQVLISNSSNVKPIKSKVKLEGLKT